MRLAWRTTRANGHEVRLRVAWACDAPLHRCFQLTGADPARLEIGFGENARSFRPEDLSRVPDLSGDAANPNGLTFTAALLKGVASFLKDVPAATLQSHKAEELFKRLADGPPEPLV